MEIKRFVIDGEDVEVEFDFEDSEQGDFENAPFCGAGVMVVGLKINGLRCNESLKINHIKEYFTELVENEKE